MSRRSVRPGSARRAAISRESIALARARTAAYRLHGHARSRAVALGGVTNAKSISGITATLAAAKVYDIEDRVTTDHALQNVVVEDPLPGGLEAIDSSFATSTKYYEATESSWQLDYQAIYRDHVLATIVITGRLRSVSWTTASR